MCFKILPFYILAIFIAIPAFSQDMKFGRYTDEEIRLESVSFEPDADAVVLEEYCSNMFIRASLNSHVHRRIKILKESGKNHGNVVLSYYKGKDGVENIHKLKAQIVNFENGEEKIVKLSKNDFFEVEMDNGWREIRFTFPEVRKGSILEYQYIKNDKSIVFLDGWVFQNKIPTLKSTYYIDIPPYLDYKVVSQGNKTFHADYRTSERGIYKWALTDLPSIRSEPFMNHFVDYLEKVELQLAGYAFRSTGGSGYEQDGYKNMFKTWQDLADLMMKRPAFESFLNPNKSLVSHLKLEETDNLSKLELAQKLYSHVVGKFEYEGNGGMVPRQNLKSILETRRGNRAEINLSLLAYLRAHNIEAYPLLVSSKGNGRSQLVIFPFADQFNQMILVINTGESLHFVDGVNEVFPMGYLPLGFHVKEGFVMMDKDSGLMGLTHQHRSGINQSVNIHFDKEGIQYSETTIRFLDYDAIGIKKPLNKEIQEQLETKIVKEEEESTLIFEIETRNESREILDVRITGNKTFESKQTIFLRPFQYLRWDENPFTSESRSFPVDFDYPFSDRFSAKLHLPEGYELDDFPEDIAFSLPGGEMAFSYKVYSMEDIVHVNASILAKESIIPAETYPNLKHFMEIVTSKLKEPIIIQKSSALAASPEGK